MDISTGCTLRSHPIYLIMYLPYFLSFPHTHKHTYTQHRHAQTHRHTHTILTYFHRNHFIAVRNYFLKMKLILTSNPIWNNKYPIISNKWNINIKCWILNVVDNSFNFIKLYWSEGSKIYMILDHSMWHNMSDTFIM